MSPDSPRGGSSGGGRPRDEAPAAMTTATSASSAFPVSSSAHTGPDGFDAKQWLAATASDVREGFARKRLLISFSEYFNLFSAAPARHVRSAAQYLRDVFDHFGTSEVSTP